MNDLLKKVIVGASIGLIALAMTSCETTPTTSVQSEGSYIPTSCVDQRYPNWSSVPNEYLFAVDAYIVLGR